MLQVVVRKERLKTQELLEEAKREAAERGREREERTAKLLEEETNRNDASHRALHKLIVVRFLCILAQSCMKKKKSPSCFLLLLLFLLLLVFIRKRHHNLANLINVIYLGCCPLK